MLRIVIPARIGSKRLPGKMMSQIGGLALIQHSVRRVLEAAVDEPWDITLATDSEPLSEMMSQECRVVMTSDSCRSGTDRCAEVAHIRGFADDDIIVNVQADMPFLHPDDLEDFIHEAEKNGSWDVLTATCLQKFVAVVAGSFKRDMVLCHVGLYAYKMDALRRFAALPQTVDEIEFGLEQLRAVAAGFKISYATIDRMPLEINTYHDLEVARCLAQMLR